MPTALAGSARCLLLPARGGCAEPDVRRAWEARLAGSDPVGAVYRSPEWLAHLGAVGPPRQLHLAVLRGGSGDVAGLAPLDVRDDHVRFQAFGRTLAAARLRVVDVLGGQPLLPEDGPLHDLLFACLADAFPACDGVVLYTVPVGGLLWRHLRASAAVRQRFRVRVCADHAVYHALRLPATYGEFLARYRAKRRYNLRRQERLLREAGGGKLELRRAEARANVPEFLARAVALARTEGGAGPFWRRGLRGGGEEEGPQYADLADRGLLRGYSLLCGGKPAAAVVGYQYGATYTVQQTLYDPAFARLSPGAVLFQLVIEDLLRWRPARLVDFGYGSPGEAAACGPEAGDYARVLLLRRTLANRLLWAGHDAFRGAARLARAALRGLRPSAPGN